MSGKTDKINYAVRWYPDFRYRDDKRTTVELKTFESTEPSITDKEAYRITLASLRGELARGSGKIDVGSYSLKAGEEYNPNKDFSFLNRKDLTIVELDDYMKVMRKELEEADAELSIKIKEELAKAEKTKETLEKEEVNKNNSVADKS